MIRPRILLGFASFSALGAAACTTSETGFLDLQAASVSPLASAGAPKPARCAADVDCPRAAPRCAPDGACVACLLDADCADPQKPYCSASGDCVECTLDVECGGAKPRCFVPSSDMPPPAMPAPTMPAPMMPAPTTSPPPYTCVECATDRDCTHDPTRSRCDAARARCVTCLVDADCPAGEHCAKDETCQM